MRSHSQPEANLAQEGSFAAESGVQIVAGAIGSVVGWTSTGGRCPRNFAIHPSGEWLVAANQDDGSSTMSMLSRSVLLRLANLTSVAVAVAVFRVDLDSGELEAVGKPCLESAGVVPHACCCLFVEGPGRGRL